MPKTTAPLLSFDARGQIAKTQVYSSWRGRSYVRRYTTPTNPNTAAQGLTRNAFSWLQQVYKYAPALFTVAWEAYIRGRVLTARNAFTKFNLPTLRPATDIQSLVFSPGSLGGPSPASVAAVAGADSIVVTVTPPTILPSGWSVQRVIALAVADQDPQSGILYTMAGDDAVAAPWECTITGLDEVEYVCGGFIEYLRDDGKLAYSPSINDLATPT